jgi:hypothetical protein
MTMQDIGRRLGVGILVFGCLLAPLPAQNPKAGAVDYAQMRPSIQKLENGINAAVTAIFGTQGMIGKPKGVYLLGYGYSFSFLVNLRWGMINTPMGSYPDSAEISPEQKKQRIEGLKDQLMRILFSQTIGMPQPEKDKSVTITAFFEETNLDGIVSKTIIMSVLKNDVDELGSKQERFNEFKQRVKIIEYEGKNH